MPHLITCPTGLTGSIRGLKVRDERFLADRKLAKSGSVVTVRIPRCDIHDGVTARPPWATSYRSPVAGSAHPGRRFLDESWRASADGAPS